MMLTVSLPLFAAPPSPPAHDLDRPASPRIGLVLAGGGAKGHAHIGVLKVLEELRIPIAAIAGTSMGALVAGAYAAGVPVAEMEQIVLTANWPDLFNDAPPRVQQSNRVKQNEYQQLSSASLGLRDGVILFPAGAISGQKLHLFFKRLAHRAHRITDFDQLPIPYRSVATDLQTGEAVIFRSGDLATAMRASMSVPGVIAPLEYEGKVLVDGGLVSNLPVEIVREMRVDRMIAVNILSPPPKKEDLSSVLAVTGQMLNVLIDQNIQRSLATLTPHDILIELDLGDISAGDFARAQEAIAIGVKAASQQRTKLQRLSLSPDAYRLWQAQRERPDPPPPTPLLDEVRIAPDRRVNPAVLAPQLRTQPQQPFDEQIAQQDVERIYGRGDFERVDYRLTTEQGRNVLTFRAFEKSWGPNYLRFGLNAIGDTDAHSRTIANLLLRYQRTWINDRGGEWQTDLQLGTTRALRTEWYQPLQAGSPWFIAATAGYENRPLDIFVDGDRVAEYHVQTVEAAFDVGLDLHTHGEVRGGVSTGYFDVEQTVGDPQLPEGKLFEVALTGRYIVDTLDHLYFPTQGQRITFGVRIPQRFLGSEVSYAHLQAEWTQAVAWGDHRLNATIRLAASPYGNTPPYYETTLGGFLNLSGLRANELRNDYLAFGRLMYYRKLLDINETLGGVLYGGLSLEAGHVWPQWDDVQLGDLTVATGLFVGADTLIGPIYLGYGLADGAAGAFYLVIGRP